MNTYTHTRIHTHTREIVQQILGKLYKWDIIITLPSRTRHIVGIPRLSRWFSVVLVVRFSYRFRVYFVRNSLIMCTSFMLLAWVYARSLNRVSCGCGNVCFWEK